MTKPKWEQPKWEPYDGALEERSPEEIETEKKAFHRRRKERAARARQRENDLDTRTNAAAPASADEVLEAIKCGKWEAVAAWLLTVHPHYVPENAVYVEIARALQKRGTSKWYLK